MRAAPLMVLALLLLAPAAGAVQPPSSPCKAMTVGVPGAMMAVGCPTTGALWVVDGREVTFYASGATAEGRFVRWGQLKRQGQGASQVTTLAVTLDTTPPGAKKRTVVERKLVLGRGAVRLVDAIDAIDAKASAVPVEDDAGLVEGLPEVCVRMVGCCLALAAQIPAVGKSCATLEKSFAQALGSAGSAAVLDSLTKSCTMGIEAYAKMPNAPAECR